MDFQYDLSPFIAFRDRAECARVRAIKKADITKHPNPDFKISVIEDLGVLWRVRPDHRVRIQQAQEEGRKFVCILPVGPMPQYAIAARMINRLRIPCTTCTPSTWTSTPTRTARPRPPDWAGSFQTAMMEQLLRPDRPGAAPAEAQIHFPSTENINDYSKMIEDLGGADVCYGGIGWCGHIAFWEADLGDEFGDDLDAYKKAGPRIVELHPMTIMQNALHSFGGDWSWVPPKADTIGPAQILGRKHRSFWLDGVLWPGASSWQRFIARLVAHGR